MSYCSEWSNKPAVTVCFITFNQEAYIEQAIESILMQETNFNVHLLIHDDCSTDNTPAIIRRYMERYPDQITAILQEENQFSQNIGIQGEILAPLIKTEFAAMNEGDDYWLDPQKLQIQYDYMMSHPGCAACCHAATQVSSEGEMKGIDMRMDFAVNDPDQNLSLPYLIDLGSKVPTNSYFYRSSIGHNGFPSFYNDCVVGDYPMILYFATCGDVHFMNRVMSAYRHNAEGSWTRSWVINPDIYVQTNLSVIEMLRAFDQYTNRRYTAEIKQKVIDYEFENLLTKRDLKSLKAEPYDKLYKDLPLGRRIRFQLASRLRLLHRLKRRRDLKKFTDT
ncbi:MAG TPA: glycosyltransferase [Clostridiaceae bacterium]|nr:glycosyltransferase [Clostridiaceae bacterium]